MLSSDYNFPESLDWPRVTFIISIQVANEINIIIKSESKIKLGLRRRILILKIKNNKKNYIFENPIGRVGFYSQIPLLSTNL